MRSNEVHLTLYLWLAVLGHFLITIVHGIAHAAAAVPLSRAGNLFVLLVIVVGPLAGLALSQWRPVAGGWFVAGTMIAALVFGIVNHFLVVGPDHVSQVGGPSRRLLASTAALLMVTEARSAGPVPGTRAGSQAEYHDRVAEGWEGWDEYAPFYDWENARTLGRRDVAFWQRVASAAGGLVLELGCGTGRVTLPLARAGARIVGIDRSAAMLARGSARARRMRSRVRNRQPGPSRRGLCTGGRECSLRNPTWLRGDIRALPFRDRTFPTVIAPYGILQSLIRPADLTATLASVARVIERGGTFGLDLVPDVPNWREYRNHVQLRGRSNGAQLTLIESVCQDRERRLTTFEQRFVERRGREKREHRFTLTFRTLTVPQMSRQLERAGFAIDAVLGDYRGRPWDARAGVWIIVAKKV
jgi:ubiquinone/menaquinone biosynthesis C-methylase UbiE